MTDTIITRIPSIDPRTGKEVETVAEVTSEQELDRLAGASADAAAGFEALGREGRAGLLRRAADALEADREAIVALADRESALGTARLTGELTRTAFQLRLFAEVLHDGGYLEATIDHAGDTAMGPRPDLRRMLVPLGPVAVFGASNFPLAFSVAGGDTASALAAGCPVLVKAHPAHPATSQRVFGRLAEVLPEGVIGLVHGAAAGAALVRHPVVRAVGFTGSLAGGRALFDLAAARPDPIPFYGELGSLNPLVVTPAAATERAQQIGEGFVTSVTLGGGQFCTKPGLAFVPEDADDLLAAICTAAAATPAATMLSRGIRDAYTAGLAERLDADGVAELATSTATAGEGFSAVPELMSVPASRLSGALLRENFGPSAVVATYRDTTELAAALGALEGSLTATVHLGADESELSAALTDLLRRRAGRIIYNGFPTGVAVSWAMQHGGPFPSSTAELHTSVGTTAIRRFLRPVSYQDAPQALLPTELRDAEPGIPRRIDGTLHTP